MAPPIRGFDALRLEKKNALRLLGAEPNFGEVNLHSENSCQTETRVYRENRFLFPGKNPRLIGFTDLRVRVGRGGRSGGGQKCKSVKV